MPGKRKREPLEQMQEEIRRIDAGEDAWLESDEIVEVQVKKPLDKVVPVRLSDEHWSALYREARELGVGPTTLARMWILEKLRRIKQSRSA